MVPAGQVESQGVAGEVVPLEAGQRTAECEIPIRNIRQIEFFIGEVDCAVIDEINILEH